MQTIWKTPEIEYPLLFEDMLNQPHLLIAGATGSGKSVVINGLMYTALTHSPAKVRFVLIDPKRVELAVYKRLPHTLRYASEPADLVHALEFAMTETDRRYQSMQWNKIKRWNGPELYVVIDELADLMTTNRKQIQPLIQRLCQVGRAAGVHVIAATQCPIAAVIPTPIKVNFDARVGLRTRCAQDSRNILGTAGCERLPRFGEGYYMTPEAFDRWDIPYIKDEQIEALVTWWMRNKPKRKWF